MSSARTAKGFTLVELLIVIALIGILSALVAPFLIAARASANQASAVQSLRTLHSAESTFASVCGEGAYTLSLSTLVSEQFASADLDLTPKSGYRFQLAESMTSTPAGTDCTGQATESGFYFEAEPLSDNTGVSGLAVNHVGAIWQDTTGVAPPEPFATAGTVSPFNGE